MSLTVFVWDPDAKHVGHASLAGKDFYVSWWPDPGPPVPPGQPPRNLPDGYLFTGARAMRLNISQDKAAEGRAPTYASAPLDQLNEAAVAAWWKEKSAYASTPGKVGLEANVKDSAATYAVFGNNCSAMVIRALLIGGAHKSDSFCEIVMKNAVITPRVVKDATEGLLGSLSALSMNSSPGFNILRDAYAYFNR
jgi:hypothetical protein